MNTTKTAQFTPGPWVVEDCIKDYDMLAIYSQEAVYIGELRNPETSEEVQTFKANAALIAAAPAMYEALRGCLRVTEAWLSQAEMNGDEVEIGAATMEIARIKTALAQAEGR